MNELCRTEAAGHFHQVNQELTLGLMVSGQEGRQDSQEPFWLCKGEACKHARPRTSYSLAKTPAPSLPCYTEVMTEEQADKFAKDPGSLLPKPCSLQEGCGEKSSSARAGVGQNQLARNRTTGAKGRGR